MDNKVYVSLRGEAKSYEQWKVWAISFYDGLEDKQHSVLPDNWFDRLSKVLKLEEVA